MHEWMPQVCTLHTFYYSSYNAKFFWQGDLEYLNRVEILGKTPFTFAGGMKVMTMVLATFALWIGIAMLFL